MTNRLPTLARSRLPDKLPRIGLALGGGGARGLAHIHVFEVLEEMGIRPDHISGTSIGALLGAAYASGLSASYIRSLTEETLSARFDMIRQLFSARTAPIQKILSVFPMRSALLDPEALLDLVLPGQVARTFEQLEIPMRVVATDLIAREARVFETGDLRKAVAASIAIPALFSPVTIDATPMVDGGIVDPLPYDTLPPDIDVVIAIDVSGGSRSVVTAAKPSMVSVLTQSVLILQKTIIHERLQRVRPDIYVEVLLEDFGGLQFHKVKGILAAAEPLKDELRSKLTRVLTSQKVD
jgi:NTE family protein